MKCIYIIFLLLFSFLGRMFAQFKSNLPLHPTSKFDYKSVNSISIVVESWEYCNALAIFDAELTKNESCVPCYYSYDYNVCMGISEYNVSTTALNFLMDKLSHIYISPFFPTANYWFEHRSVFIVNFNKLEKDKIGRYNKTTIIKGYSYYQKDVNDYFGRVLEIRNNSKYKNEFKGFVKRINKLLYYNNRYQRPYNQ